ncbi:uncharacterized protein LOC131643485 [Vicia villosa]|uniref:uncharacterized protein LOC131643485 n=1 Tax=Vicia villosa TaxID=3911 RepID=UPI00273C3D93|nr:uncharacterized protein LOC131643485 [Vicia villosa]
MSMIGVLWRFYQNLILTSKAMLLGISNLTCLLHFCATMTKHSQHWSYLWRRFLINLRYLRHPQNHLIFFFVLNNFIMPSPLHSKVNISAFGHKLFVKMPLTPVKTFKNNMVETLNILGLLTSTSEVYGDPLHHPLNENYLGNVNPICVRSFCRDGKCVAEALVMDYHQRVYVEVRNYWIFNSYTPRRCLDVGCGIRFFFSRSSKMECLTVYRDAYANSKIKLDHEWISIGSLVGFTYSFLPTGVLKIFLGRNTENSIVQTGPLLDCSGIVVYTSQIEMEGKVSHNICEYTNFSAFRQKAAIFTKLAPTTGSIYWAEVYPSQVSTLLSKGSLSQFFVKGEIPLTVLAASKVDISLPCRAFGQKLATSCAPGSNKLVNLYSTRSRQTKEFVSKYKGKYTFTCGEVISYRTMAKHYAEPEAGYELPTGYFPFGVDGMLAGSATAFFAYVGFDAVASTVEEEIACYMDLDFGKVKIKRFADGEIYAQLQESVIGCDVFLVQPTCPPANENLMELLVMIDACRRASAKNITAVIPYFGYARADRKTQWRESIAVKLVENLITEAGANCVLACDLHSGQSMGYFYIPVDHVYGQPVILGYLASKTICSDDLVVVSRDVGGVARARAFAKKLSDALLAIVDKRRHGHKVAEVMNLIGDVKGKVAVMVDDMIDTGPSPKAYLIHTTYPNISLFLLFTKWISHGFGYIKMERKKNHLDHLFQNELYISIKCYFRTLRTRFK